MKTVRIGSCVSLNLKNSLRSGLYHLFVDVVPTLLLLAALAYSMAFVSHLLTDPRAIDLEVVSKLLF